MTRAGKPETVSRLLLLPRELRDQILEEALKGDVPITPRWALAQQSGAIKVEVGIVCANKQLHAESMRILHQVRTCRLRLSADSCSLLATTNHVLYANSKGQRSLLAPMRGFRVVNIILPPRCWFDHLAGAIARITSELTCDGVNRAERSIFIIERHIAAYTHIWVPFVVEVIDYLLTQSSAAFLGFGQRDKVLSSVDRQLKRDIARRDRSPRADAVSAWHTFVHCWEERLTNTCAREMAGSSAC
jgi:hypothetical protein